MICSIFFSITHFLYKKKKLFCFILFLFYFSISYGLESNQPNPETILVRTCNLYEKLNFNIEFYQIIKSNICNEKILFYGKLYVLDKNNYNWLYIVPYSQLVVISNNFSFIFNKVGKQIFFSELAFFKKEGFFIIDLFIIERLKENFFIFVSKRESMFYKFKLVSRFFFLKTKKSFLKILKKNLEIISIRSTKIDEEKIFIKFRKINFNFN